MSPISARRTRRATPGNTGATPPDGAAGRRPQGGSDHSRRARDAWHGFPTLGFARAGGTPTAASPDHPCTSGTRAVLRLALLPPLPEGRGRGSGTGRPAPDAAR